MPSAPMLAAVVTAAYFGVGVGSLQLLALQPPRWIEVFISIFAAPAVILLRIWTPLLRRFGWVRGEWYVMPNPAASVVLVAGYAAFVYCIASGVQKWLAR